jgi:hypothetical protein
MVSTSLLAWRPAAAACSTTPAWITSTPGTAARAAAAARSSSGTTRRQRKRGRLQRVGQQHVFPALARHEQAAVARPHRSLAGALLHPAGQQAEGIVAEGAQLGTAERTVQPAEGGIEPETRGLCAQLGFLGGGQQHGGMRLQAVQPSGLDIVRAGVGAQQIRVRAERGAPGIGGAARLFPARRAHQHHDALLGGVHHVGEGLLQHRIALVGRQQRQDVGIRHDALAQPQPGVMAEQQAHHQCPQQCETLLADQNCAASSGKTAPGPVLSSENAMSVRSPPCSTMWMLRT